MPIYEYRCEECGKIFEKIQKGFDERTEPCPTCGGQAGRIISNTSFVLKGSGWYVTDYCNRHGGAESAKSGGNGEGTAKAGAPGSSGPTTPEKSAPAAPCAAKSSGAACDVSSK